MLRLTPTTITLTQGELPGLEHRPRRKGLLERMADIQIHEEDIEEDYGPVDTADDGRGLRDEDSTRSPLHVPSPNSRRFNQRLDPRAPEYVDAGSSRLRTAMMHEVAIAETAASKPPHRRQRSHSHNSQRPARQPSGGGLILPPPFSTRPRATTNTAAAGTPQQQRSFSSTERTMSTPRTADPFGHGTQDLPIRSNHAAAVVAPSPTLPMYNDSVSPTLQPQTPQHLPESRHWSRLDDHRPTSSRQRGIVRPDDDPGDREPPRGSAADGFDGLYEGVENIDDDALYERSRGRRAIL